MDETEHEDDPAGDEFDAGGAGEGPAAPASAGGGEHWLLAALPGDLDPLQAYLLAVGTAVTGVVAGVVLFPRAVYDRFIWKYFWGPVYADAHNSTCAYLTESGPAIPKDTSTCAQQPTSAFIGYNTYNEIGYAVVLLVALAGVVLLLRRLEIGEDPAFFWGLLPYMFLGGAVRVVEDAANAARSPQYPNAEPALTYPLNTLFISPIIYFTVFFFTVAALAAAIWAERAGHVESYERALAAIGGTALALTLSYLLVLAVTTRYVQLLPQFTILVLLFATLVTAAVWWAIEEYRPSLNEGTGLMGAAVIWGHSVDGVANVIGLDWANELGLSSDLVPKHPVNRAVVELSEQWLPESIASTIGVAWPFLLIKVAVAVGVVAIFDEQVFEESPRYSMLMLVAILAVGLGPGSRDMLRATFGV